MIGQWDVGCVMMMIVRYFWREFRRQTIATVVWRLIYSRQITLRLCFPNNHMMHKQLQKEDKDYMELDEEPLIYPSTLIYRFSNAWIAF